MYKALCFYSFICFIFSLILSIYYLSQDNIQSQILWSSYTIISAIGCFSSRIMVEIQKKEK